MSWIMLPKNYEPDTVDSRRESGQEYVKYYSAAAYEQLLCAARKMYQSIEAHFTTTGCDCTVCKTAKEFAIKYGVK